MTTYLIANTTDALGGADWTFDASNFLVGPAGTGVNVGAPTNPDQANSVNVAGNIYINNVSAEALLAPLASPTFTGTATFVTVNTVTANVTTCQAAHYLLNGLDIKAGRALTTATSLIPAGYTNPGDVFLGLNQTIKPAVSGLIAVLVSCQATNTNNFGEGYQIFYGTGTPPALGQLVSVTPGWTKIFTTNAPDNTFNEQVVVCAMVPFVGSVGTTYWVDLGLVGTAGTILANINISLVEI